MGFLVQVSGYCFIERLDLVVPVLSYRVELEAQRLGGLLPQDNHSGQQEFDRDGPSQWAV
jgi:hypothetical protein